MSADVSLMPTLAEESTLETTPMDGVAEMEGTLLREEARRALLWVLLAAFGLTLIGILAIYAVGFRGTSVHRIELANRQMIRALIAIGLGATSFMIGHRRLTLWSRPLLLATWALLLLLFIPGIPVTSGRWLKIPGLGSIQPSEAAKLVMILFLAGFAALKGERLQSLREGFIPAMGYVVVTATLVMLAPDVGQGVVILVLSSAVLLVNGLRITRLFPIAAACVAAVWAMSQAFEYVQRRLDAFFGYFDRGVDPTSQVGQGLVALAAGSIDGRGIGAGRAQLFFVPEIHNDLVLVTIGEQAGFWGSALVLMLFITIVVNGLRIAKLARTTLGKSVAFAITFMIGLQAAVNIAVVTASAPPKGISLPFVSYGGSGLMMLGTALGLLASVADGVGGPKRMLVENEDQVGFWRRWLFPVSDIRMAEAEDDASETENDG